MKVMIPKQDVVQSFGKVMYEENARAHVLLRFKRRIINLFPQLKEKRSISYELKYCWNYDKTIQELHLAKADKKGLPILLYIYGDSDE